jgi:hypothetical protein
VASQTVTIRLPRLRPLQRDLAQARKRFNVWVCHRRFGKSVLTLCLLLKDALENPRPQPRYAYIAPLYKQAKAIAWDYCKRLARQLPDTTTNEAELRLDLPNGARLQLLGADNPDALRGIYLDGVVFDEYAQMVPRVWREIVRPSLADRQGWAIWIGTPWGRNHFYDLYTQAPSETGDWHTALYRASDTGVILPSELASARSQMTQEEYEQEFECSWMAAIPGAYYASEFRRIDQEHRCTRVPYDPLYEVYTSWDLGVDDSTAIWFAQCVGREIRLIDYYEHSGEGLPHYAKVLKDKPYSYACHFLPHDVDVREFTSGRSRLEAARTLLPGQIEVVAQVPLIDGITATRLLLPRCVFEAERCHQGIEALRNYRHAWDEELRAFRDAPLHNWASHGADALRYLALSVDRLGAYEARRRQRGTVAQVAHGSHFDPLTGGAYAR